MIRRQFRLPLSILQTPFQVVTSYVPSTDQLAQDIKSQQAKMKAYFDHKHPVQIPKFQPGQLVRINNPVRRHKISPAYSKPIAIKKQLSPTSFRLSDGSLWNADLLIEGAAVTSSPQSEPLDRSSRVPAESRAVSHEAQPHVRRSNRPTSRPAAHPNFHVDYHT